MRTTRRVRTGLITAVASVWLLAACDDDTSGPGTTEGGLEIAGDWEDGGGGTETIADASWTFSYGLTATITGYDNNDNVAVLQNPPEDEFNPDKFSKIVWTEPTGGAFYYCTVAFGLDTAEDAEMADASVADEGDLDGEGCGGFPWTRLTRI